MTLEELSEESASHPSNVEKGRLIDVRLKEDVASNGVKSKSSQNGSEDSQN